MQILLASAKIMRERCRSVGIAPSCPLFQDKALAIAEELSHRTATELSEMFGCSPAIGEQNRERFAVFGTDEAEVMPAVLAYNGQAYKHLKADMMEDEDLLWANGHLWISSCLYGLLRPLDGINTYRMEGGFPLACTAGRKVYEFWRPLLTDVLIESVKADDGILVYLDTEEFRTLFDWKRVVSEVPDIIEPEFHVRKGDRLTTPSVWAKTCRGAMTRYIILNRIASPDNLEAFSYEGFEFECRPDEGTMIFTRND